MHASGLIHCDVKLDNMLITAEGTIKVSDLGCALQATEDGPNGLAYWQWWNVQRVGACVGGTLGYMPPEQLLSVADGGRFGVHVCQASDVWSFGVSLLQLVYAELGLSGFYRALEESRRELMKGLAYPLLAADSDSAHTETAHCSPLASLGAHLTAATSEGNFSGSGASTLTAGPLGSVVPMSESLASISRSASGGALRSAAPAMEAEIVGGLSPGGPLGSVVPMSESLASISRSGGALRSAAPAMPVEAEMDGFSPGGPLCSHGVVPMSESLASISRSGGALQSVVAKSAPKPETLTLPLHVLTWADRVQSFGAVLQRYFRGYEPKRRSEPDAFIDEKVRHNRALKTC